MQMEMQMQMAKPEGEGGAKATLPNSMPERRLLRAACFVVVVVVVATYIWQPLSTPFGNSRFICM